jgi:ATP-dependent Lon protease
MASDKKKKGKSHKYNTRGKTKDEEYGTNESSDDESWETDDEEEEMDVREYRKLLSKVFPSKYIKDKVKATPKKGKRRPVVEEESEEESEEPSPRKSKKSDKKKKKLPSPKKQKSKKKKKKVVSESEESESEESDSDEEGIEDVLNDARASKFNIIFTMGGASLGDAEYEDDSEQDYEEDEEDYEESEEESEEESSDEESEEEEESPRKTKKRSSKEEEDDDSVTDTDALAKFREMAKGLTESEKKNKMVKGMLKDLEGREKEHKKRMDKKHRKVKNKNTGEFRKLLRDKNVMNDVRYFKDSMSIDQQKIVLRQMKEVKDHCEIEKPYRLALLDSDIPTAYKACAYRKVNTLKYMDPGSGEYYKIKNWVDTFMQIPFGKHNSLPLTLEDGVDKCHTFMDEAKGTLDGAVFGLDDAKLQVMQLVGQWIANPAAVGTAIAIKGPMGTGKTTLVKEGISKILGREFAFIALGGATDSSFLEGHSYTYEGSTWGKIVDILIQCKSMNPVIYFDELDKLSDTPKGEEITGILTHLTDTSQNSKFHDKYFAELDFDLSRCLFIFSYNDEHKINPILRDRMYRIQTKGYNQKEKTTIANDHLLPKIREQVKFNSDDIVIPEATLHHIISVHTEKEDGVRNLKRCLEIIHTKLNLYRLMKPGTNLFEKDMSVKVTFPVTVTPAIVDKLVKKEDDGGAWRSMYM